MDASAFFFFLCLCFFLLSDFVVPDLSASDLAAGAGDAAAGAAAGAAGAGAGVCATAIPLANAPATINAINFFIRVPLHHYGALATSIPFQLARDGKSRLHLRLATVAASGQALKLA